MAKSIDLAIFCQSDRMVCPTERFLDLDVFLGEVLHQLWGFQIVFIPVAKLPVLVGAIRV